MAMTYDDFLNLTEWNGDRYEAINRDVYKMPSPSEPHQTVCRNLTEIIGNFLKGKPCRLFIQPFDVFLGDDVVIPDLFVVCDKNKIAKKGCVGVPDLVIEVISPSSSKRDLVTKRELYLKNEVREYWIVFPSDKHVIVHTLNGNDYDEAEYLETDVIYSQVLAGLPLELKFIFDECSHDDYLEYLVKRILKLDVSKYLD